MKTLGWIAFASVSLLALWDLGRGCLGWAAGAGWQRVEGAATQAVASQAGLAVESIEARSAAVFAGACHYMGEAESNGRDALVAWRFAGRLEQAQLDGLLAAAAIVGADNLAEGGARRSVLWIDARADREQAQAIEAWARREQGQVLGELLAVKRGALAFEREGDRFRAELPGVFELQGLGLADRACCAMPEWRCYEPLGTPAGRAQTVAWPSPSEDATRLDSETPALALVGNAEVCRFLGAAGLPAWAYEGGNNVFLWTTRQAEQAHGSANTYTQGACAADATCCPPSRSRLCP